MRVELRLSARALLESWDLDVVWVSSGADVVVFDPRSEPRPSEPCIAFLDRDADDHGLVHPAAMRCAGVRADAYAGDRRGLVSALGFLEATLEAPRVPHLLFLGGLGTVAASAEVGTIARIGERCVVGRDAKCDLVLRQGGHSDQNLVARLHADLRQVDGAVVVRDLQSTNGTRVGGRRIEEPTACKGAGEIAIAECFRVLVRIPS